MAQSVNVFPVVHAISLVSILNQGCQTLLVCRSFLDFLPTKQYTSGTWGSQGPMSKDSKAPSYLWFDWFYPLLLAHFHKSAQPFWFSWGFLTVSLPSRIFSKTEEIMVYFGIFKNYHSKNWYFVISTPEKVSNFTMVIYQNKPWFLPFY